MKIEIKDSMTTMSPRAFGWVENEFERLREENKELKRQIEQLKQEDKS